MTFEEALRNAMPIADTSDLRDAYAHDVERARREGAREALLKVIDEDKRGIPLTFSVPMHGPCHPSDPNRQCAAHRVLCREYS